MCQWPPAAGEEDGSAVTFEVRASCATGVSEWFYGDGMELCQVFWIWATPRLAAAAAVRASRFEQWCRTAMRDGTYGTACNNFSYDAMTQGYWGSFQSDSPRGSSMRLAASCRAPCAGWSRPVGRAAAKSSAVPFATHPHRQQRQHPSITNPGPAFPALVLPSPSCPTIQKPRHRIIVVVIVGGENPSSFRRCTLTATARRAGCRWMVGLTRRSEIRRTGGPRFSGAASMLLYDVALRLLVDIGDDEEDGGGHGYGSERPVRPAQLRELMILGRNLEEVKGEERKTTGSRQRLPTPATNAPATTMTTATKFKSKYGPGVVYCGADHVLDKDKKLAIVFVQEKKKEEQLEALKESKEQKEEEESEEAESNGVYVTIEEEVEAFEATESAAMTAETTKKRRGGRRPLPHVRDKQSRRSAQGVGRGDGGLARQVQQTSQQFETPRAPPQRRTRRSSTPTTAPQKYRE